MTEDYYPWTALNKSLKSSIPQSIATWIPNPSQVYITFFLFPLPFFNHVLLGSTLQIVTKINKVVYTCTTTMNAQMIKQINM